ncbi:MAG: quinone-dependent dihydroorotate dehydrogenase [Verrucomicrobiaceae bacterium]|nr:MAG: quinone-dependent dihydroorotate dehydrogenase [Verrucomicrobiaceae bacterium]
MNFYTDILRPGLFRFDPETAHHLALTGLRLTPSPLVRALFGGEATNPVRLFGLTFPNPVGLAAGMDKNAEVLGAWETLGFGFVEAGTVTALAQPGNDQPRCFRYPRLEALINRMGFNNDGAEKITARLASLKSSGRWPRIPVGMNIGKSKVTPLEEAARDYATSFRLLLPFGDYFVINVSSPNTPGLRQLQDRSSLAEIVRTLKDIDATKPLLVKIAPDLSDEAVREMAALAETEKLDGLIATNTTLDHSAVPRESDQTGGLSGSPLRSRSTEVLKLLRAETSLPIIASGGVMSADSAVEKLRAGASLVQIYTGFIYRGPGLIREISRAWHC